jgi:hypothetical protein
LSVTEAICKELKLVQRLFVKISWTEFHENPTHILVNLNCIQPVVVDNK